MSENAEIIDTVVKVDGCVDELPGSIVEDKTMESVTDVNNGTEPTVVLSKRAQKKLVKKEKQTIIKKLRRAHEKADMKKRNAEKRERGEPIRVGPSRKELKRNKANDTPSIIKVAIDLTFDDLMIEKDLAKCSKVIIFRVNSNLCWF